MKSPLLQKFYIIIAILALSYLFIFAFVTIIGAQVYTKFIRPELVSERKTFEKKLLKDLVDLKQKISKLNSYQRLLNLKVIEKQTTSEPYIPFRYLNKYPHILECKNNLNPWSPGLKPADVSEYEKKAPEEYLNSRITRAIVIYFPIKSRDHFGSELRWLYRSWINMQKYEPATWRTDLVIFIDDSDPVFSTSDFFLNKLNCKFENVRTSPNDSPMCTLVKYKSLKSRNIPKSDQQADYKFILDNINIFSEDEKVFEKFYALLNNNLLDYGYLDSILMAFEGYKFFKSAGYDFLVRSDMDVFLTPFFAQWMPRHCNDFLVGRGGYSTMFNRKRFGRIAQNLGLNYANEGGLGSTWISTPEQFRLVAYLTLFGMGYLNVEEFAEPERKGQLGVMMWPDWHYGVLLLYGQNLILNHLIANKDLNIVKLEELIDFPTSNTYNVNQKVHLHVFHGDDMFSKFAFSAGHYDNMTVSESDSNAHEIKYYALRMALESKRMTAIELNTKFKTEILPKKN